MEFSEEWKSRWFVSSAFRPPLLLSNKSFKTTIGPLIFKPDPNTAITQVLHSPSLSPHLPPQYPNLSLPRFLRNYDSIPSSAASICSVLGPQLPNNSSLFHGFNSLQLLRVPNRNLVIAFFPTGENSDRVGFTVLEVKDGTFGIHSQIKDFFQLAKEGWQNHHRITKLLVNPIDETYGDDLGYGTFSDPGNSDKRNGAVVIGLLMVCTDYSVHWYRVGLNPSYTQNEVYVCLDYLGFSNAKNFNGNIVASACWSPYLKQECLVLLENGALFLFDIDYSCERKDNMISVFGGNKRAVRKRVQWSLNDKVGWEEEEDGVKCGGWFDCAFSWHPRIFILSRCNSVFLFDFRSGECDVSCLLRLETVSMVKNDIFVSFSRVASDMFFFAMATKHMLLLCDVRKPLMPVLRWMHNVSSPQYMAVFRLSELRANANENKYAWASESGRCIFLGSFWDCEFCTFCYGPNCNENGTVSSEISKFCNSYYAWGLPSELSLSCFDCNCGSCVLRDEFSKASLPIWLDWRQKKDLALGFGILDSDLSISVGGFTLIRLMSSGKLEAQQYFAAWASERFLEVGHKRKSIFLEDNLLYDTNDLGYDGQKKFKHMKLDGLNAYCSDKLAQYIVKRKERKESGENAQDNKYQVKSDFSFHQEICEKMKALRLDRERSSTFVSAVLNDVTSPTSIYEVALRSVWGALPTKLLQLGFCTYLDFYKDTKDNNEPLEFLGIPTELQMPPFLFGRSSLRSNKWSSKVQPCDSIVGPVVSPLVLAMLHKLKMQELKKEKEMYLEETEDFSAHFQFKSHCDGVMEIIEQCVSGSISLDGDADEITYGAQNLKLSHYRPSEFSKKPLKSWVENDMFIHHVFKRNRVHALDLKEDMVGEQLFDLGCPMELRFVGSTTDIGQKEMEIYQSLKKHELQFLKSYEPYQKIVSSEE